MKRGQVGSEYFLRRGRCNVPTLQGRRRPRTKPTPFPTLLPSSQANPWSLVTGHDGSDQVSINVADRACKKDKGIASQRNYKTLVLVGLW